MRVASLVAAAVAGLLSIGLLAAGALLLWGNAQKDDGYLATSTERFATTTSAMATESLDIDSDGTGWIVDHDRYGKIRLTVDAGAPVFVGIAPTRDVDAYLRGTRHDVVTDIEYDHPFRADYERHDGDRRPAPPAAQGFWAASTHGAGRRTLTWDVRHGDWSVVVMNEDASPGVAARISAGAEVTFLGPLGWGFGIAGAVLLLFAAALAVVGVRTSRRAPVAA